MKRTRAALIAAAVLLGVAVRLPLLGRQGLWADEVFSLAIATGHSLEHPAAEADPALGDFVLPDAPVRAAELGRYLAHEEPACGPGRVVRAVELSDTSPPLYYLALWAWTRALGTSDVALRGLSLALFLASLPFLAALARRAGGPRAVAPALLLYGWSPISIYATTEGRQYALLWLCVLASAWAAAALRARGASAARIAALVLASAAGLWTHYFFIFAWAPLIAVTWLDPRRLRRGALLAALAAVALAALPWYAQVGASLARWRITAGWLEIEPAGFDRARATLDLVLGPLGGGDYTSWGARRTVASVALAVVLAGAAVALVRKRTRAFTGARGPIWAWMIGAWLGPLAFDAWRGTYTVAVPRYALAWLPAGLILLGGAAAALPRAPRWLWLGAICALWALQIDVLMHKRTRMWCPLREAAGFASGKPADDLVLVHSIPSGVLGVARYLRGDAPIAGWVGALGVQRVPESIEALVDGRRQVHFLGVHEVGEPAPEEEWLRAHATLLHEGRFEGARHAVFGPAGGATFRSDHGRAR